MNTTPLLKGYTVVLHLPKPVKICIFKLCCQVTPNLPPLNTTSLCQYQVNQCRQSGGGSVSDSSYAPLEEIGDDDRNDNYDNDGGDVGQYESIPQ